MGLMTITFCDVNISDVNTTVDEADRAALNSMKETFNVITTVLCIFGIGGNILNLKTLQASSLQTVPFMYIRSLAIFDMIGLLGVLFHANNKVIAPDVYAKFFYKAHIEPVVINTFFIGGLYCAFMLTVERYRLITYPHCRQSKPKQVARRRILLAICMALALHLPLGLQFVPTITKNGYSVGNNVNLLCSPPWEDIFNYYKLIRELLRFACVISMTTLNVVIAKRLQQTKKRRREMILRSTTSLTTIGGPNSTRSSIALSVDNLQKREFAHLFRAFTEKKLTVLMLGICLIYVSGNLPQMLIMILQDESKETIFRFQVYRQVGNTLEVLNHCVNFYVFCMASSEYSRAFLTHCRCLRGVPLLQGLASAPLSGVVSVASMNAQRREDGTIVEMRDMSSSSGRKITPNAHIGDDDTFSQRKISQVSGPWMVTRKDTLQSTDTESLLNLGETDDLLILDGEQRPLRGILVNSTRRLSNSGFRQKRSLTIVNTVTDGTKAKSPTPSLRLANRTKSLDIPDSLRTT